MAAFRLWGKDSNVLSQNMYFSPLPVPRTVGKYLRRSVCAPEASLGACSLAASGPVQRISGFPTNGALLLLLEGEVVELQGAGVLGDDADGAVVDAGRDVGVDLEGDADVGSQK